MIYNTRSPRSKAICLFENKKPKRFLSRLFVVHIAKFFKKICQRARGSFNSMVSDFLNVCRKPCLRSLPFLIVLFSSTDFSLSN